MATLDISTDSRSTSYPFPVSQPVESTPTFGMGELLAEEQDYGAPQQGDIRTGVVVDINDDGLVLDIGFKREGLVPADDLERLDEKTRSEIQIGATVAAFVLRTEDRDGHPVLSLSQARMYEDWIKAEQMMASGELYEGEVAGYNRGGLIVKFGKIRGFVPTSQIAEMPKRMQEEQRQQRLEAMIGQRLGLKIIEVDRQRRRLIFSQRRAFRAWQDIQRQRVMSNLVKGETRRGKVTSITDFGAFVDLGGADGLIHVSEMSWGRVTNPRQVLKVGDELDVYVLDVDPSKKRIALSLKKLQPDPWTLVEERFEVGSLVEGQVTRVLDFGAFIEIAVGQEGVVEGLLHASEIIGAPELKIADVLHPGEKLLVKIIRIDTKKKRLALSAKQVRKGEWERWAAEHQAPPRSEQVEAASEEVKEAAMEEAVVSDEEVAEVTLEAEADVAPDSASPGEAGAED